jgi:hypothetical protein
MITVKNAKVFFYKKRLGNKDRIFKVLTIETVTI